MRSSLRIAGAAALALAAAPAGAQAPLQVYVVDVEGGKAVLFVAPGGESVLIDSGMPGGRDVGRILDVLAVAGVERIDYLVSTHYHIDHIGGVLELAERVPIAHFVDHGSSVEEREQVEGFQGSYAALWARAEHTVVRPGDRLEIPALDWLVVTSGGSVLEQPLSGAGHENPLCAGAERRETRSGPENAQSIGSLVRYGRFRALDLGDLLWNEELELMCPDNPIGAVDLLVVTHHGLAASNAPPLVHGLRPRVAVMQNGSHKGGAVEVFQTLRSSPGLEDIWLAHWSHHGRAEHNPPGLFIANTDDASIAEALAGLPDARTPRPSREAMAHSPAHYLRIEAHRDGSFVIANSRNGFSKSYPARD